MRQLHRPLKTATGILGMTLAVIIGLSALTFCKTTAPAETPPDGPSFLAGNDYKLLAIYGNSYPNNGVHAAIINMVLNDAPEAIIHTGNMVRAYTEAEWQLFENITAPVFKRGIPFIPCRGDSDTLDPDDVYGSISNKDIIQKYKNRFGLDRLYSSFNIDKVLFIVGDTYGFTYFFTKTSQQYRWLEQLLTEERGRYTHAVLILHYPIYSSGQFGPGSHETANYGSPQRNLLLPLIEKHNINVVITGHDGSYERLADTRGTYIVTGGGGADLTKDPNILDRSDVFHSEYHYCRLYIYDDDQLYLETVGTDGKILDKFKIPD